VTTDAAFDPRQLAAEWITAWNDRDLDAVLRHYADDVQFTSPTAAAVVPESGGVVRGKDALREYWSAALPLVPDLHFDLVDVLTTVDGLTIVYRNQRAQLVAETLLLRPDGLVWWGLASYSEPGAPSAS
jgi:ketosteroid isomerase-like protein